MPTLTRIMSNRRGSQDGRIWNDGGQWKWSHADQTLAVVIGQFIVCRMYLNIPKGATINKATFTTEYVVKDETQQGQTASFDVFMERYSPEYPTTNDTFIGIANGFPPYPRLRTQVGSSTSIYSINTPGIADIFSAPVTLQVQEIVNHRDYEPGQPVAVVLACNSEGGDISLQMTDNEFAARRPQIEVTFTYDVDADDRRWNFNESPNQSWELDLEMSNMGTAFGTWTAGQTAVKSSEQKRSGDYSIKVISGPTEGNKGFAFQQTFDVQAGSSYTFSGYVWIPAHLPRGVTPSTLFAGHAGEIVNTREQWVPFSTQPIPSATWDRFTAEVSMAGPSDASYYFYLDDLTLTESTYKQAPFTGETPDTANRTYSWPRGSSHLKGQSTRLSRARTYTFNGAPVLLDNCEDTVGWGGTGIVYNNYQQTVEASVPNNSGGPTRLLTYTKTLPRSKRYLAVESHSNDTTYMLLKIIKVGGAEVPGPPVAGTEGLWKFYDMGPDDADIAGLEFLVYTIANPSLVYIHSISETDVPATTVALRPRAGWVLNSNGLWVRSDPERRSPSWDDYEENGMTWDQLKVSGMTWDQMEADTSI